jgi:hypothetical protein
MTPPMIVGTREERIEQAQMVQFVPVNVVARLGFTPSRLRDLIGVLEVTLENFERQEKHQGDPRDR